MEELDLWDYRRQVAEVYREVRLSADPAGAWGRWQDERDRLFREHPQSPLDPAARRAFGGLPYFPYDPAWRVTGVVRPVAAAGGVALPHSGAGDTPFGRFGHVEAETPAGPVTLTLFWLDSYGGGVFLPFRDGTSGVETYGGGRYLLDTAKGADLGHEGDRVVLDFNFAFHPSCVHDARWSCPLPPPENDLRIRVPAGERL